jgi:hypothetical protein
MSTQPQGEEAALVVPFEEWVQRLHATRRHGATDELGSLNYIDDAARARAREAIVTGECVGLAADLKPGPTVRQDGAQAFALEIYSSSAASGFPMPPGFAMQSDHLELDCHGLSNTHIDALNHMGFFGTWFDGSAISTSTGAGSVYGLARFGIFTRAVHVDVAAACGGAYVEPDRPVDGADIDAALDAAGVTFQQGDCLLLDCGRDRFEAVHGPWPAAEPRPGPGPGVARWIERHNPSLLCWDMLDGDNDEQVIGPIHHLNWAIGLVLVDNCDFSVARAALHERSPGTAAIVVAPLPIRGATGNNVNPMLLL